MSRAYYTLRTMAEPEDPIRLRIRKRLVRFREELDKSQDELAADIEERVGALRTWEQGTAGIKVVNLDKLAKALGRSVNDFLSEEEPPPLPEEKRPAHIRYNKTDSRLTPAQAAMIQADVEAFAAQRIAKVLDETSTREAEQHAEGAAQRKAREERARAKGKKGR
jgi:transcriptional regulator with XRE-family HTH domain